MKCLALIAFAASCSSPREAPEPTPGGIVAHPVSPWKRNELGCPGYIGVSSEGIVSCALCSTGTVHCWGTSDAGLLGDRNGGGPIVKAIEGICGAIELVATYAYGCVRSAGGGVSCWGDDVASMNGPIELPAPALAIGIGGYHACALLATNEIACWGENHYRQLGVNDLTPASPGVLSPRLVPALRASAIAVGGSVGCAIDLERQVWCWGWSGHEQSSPMHRIDGLADAVLIATDGEHACAQRASGEVLCWNLGTPSLPAQSHGSFPIARALAVDETAVGVLGTDGRITLVTDREKTVVDLPAARSLSMGDGARCVVLETGELRCWGANHRGFLVIR